MPLLSNYYQDILKSRNTPLLIELSKDDLSKFGKNGFQLAYYTAQKIYDRPLATQNTKETNIIYLDADTITDQNRVAIFDTFLDASSKQLQNMKNLGIVKEGISQAISYATGGFLDSTFGVRIDSAISSVIDIVHDDFFDFLVNSPVKNIDVSKQVLAEIESLVSGTIKDSGIDFLDAVTENELYLTDEAKSALNALSDAFKEELTSVELFRLIIKLMLSISIGMPKLLFIKNPHKLDKDSLAILSLLFSFGKDLKDTSSHTGISVVYAYEDDAFQPYKQVGDKYKLSKQFLSEQRLFTQRYAMLERPTSDIPYLAVKSSLFVGRQEELQRLNARYHYSKQNEKIATLETVSGEPGIGKTKLIKKHLETIVKEEKKGAKQIQLTVLNQVGHSSTNTGLSSLTDSIIQEAERLVIAKALDEKIIDSAKKFALNSTFNYIKTTLGVNALISVGGAVNDSLFLENKLEHTKDAFSGD
ncbi:ATP-binding protein [Sulfurimonas sp. SAG-AH-194-C21]|nr:hypothetical protein [Sulfurimonas sp. SAG-AH-194-C21]MDF1883990.1 ATP-binding protein [Sulfurimonas sp. SAG-AH-194-C21]